MCGNISRKTDHIDCKIIAFEVKKRSLFCTVKNKVCKLWILLAYKLLYYKVEVFDIMLENWVENPKRNKTPKNIFIFIL
jgi:hypothetical protein